MALYKGTTKIKSIYKGTTKIAKIYKGTTLVYSASRLPAEFQEVEYIESSGTQYIDSGYCLKQNVYLKTNIQFTSTTNNQLNGVYSGATNYRLQFGITNYKFFIGIGNETEEYSNPDTNKHLFEINLANKQYGIDSNLTTDSTITIEDTTKNILLFAFLNGYSNEPNYFCSQKMYDLQIYDNNVLVRNFIPCYRKADNEIGLYDLVNGVFYTNAGTGTFTKGGNV